MSNIFITSDEHYGHKNILIYCKRPFANVDEMRETLIERHNKKVPNNRNVLTIHVGDMFWNTLSVGEAATIIGRLHGRHAFIFGNHDELIEQHKNEFIEFFDWIRGENKASGTHILHFNKHELTLCHYSMTVWSKSHKGSWHVFGHSHGELKTKGKSFDIGVDSHNFEPWSLEEIEAEMERRPQGHVIPADKVWPGKEVE
jgi:calcineurin-like phosphoesterase family protein